MNYTTCCQNMQTFHVVYMPICFEHLHVFTVLVPRKIVKLLLKVRFQSEMTLKLMLCGNKFLCICYVQKSYDGWNKMWISSLFSVSPSGSKYLSLDWPDWVKITAINEKACQDLQFSLCCNDPALGWWALQDSFSQETKLTWRLKGLRFSCERGHYFHRATS